MNPDINPAGTSTAPATPVAAVIAAPVATPAGLQGKRRTVRTPRKFQPPGVQTQAPAPKQETFTQ